MLRTARPIHRDQQRFLLQPNPHPEITDNASHTDTPLIVYNHPNGSLYRGDAIDWLKSLPSRSVDLIFADPPYNIKKAVWDEFESHQDHVDWSVRWIAEASRLLKDSGSLYVCGFSEILADIKAPSMPFFHGCRWIVWHYKNKANLGNDWGRSQKASCISESRRSLHSTSTVSEYLMRNIL